MERNRRRVVVTGMGTLNSIGGNLTETWQALQQGKCGIAPIEQIDVSMLPVTIAGEIKNFDAGSYMEKKEARKMARFSQFAVAASRMAMEMAGLKDNFNVERAGIFLGVGIGGFQDIEDGVRAFDARGAHAVPPLFIPKLITNESAGNAAINLGLKGPNCVVTTACSSGTDAIIQAADVIRLGRADIMLTGGTEAAITQLSIGGFAKLGALATNFNDNPSISSRPFDRDRTGFVMGEGAGVLVLEEYEHAKARGANIICEYAGGAMTCDAYHLTSPAPDGNGAIRAFTLALQDANLKPTDIGYLNAHATSTPMNDPLESNAIVKAFGDYATKGLLVSGTKGNTGHCLGAAGGIEAIIAIQALTTGFVPPTINLDNPDVEQGCILNCVPHKGIQTQLKAVMSDSLGFGGHNGVVAFTKL